MRKNKREKFLEQESQTIYNSIHSMLEGNLEVYIDENKTSNLLYLAKDINQLAANLNQYIYETSRVLSHLSTLDLSVSILKDISFEGNFYPMKTALKKITTSLNHIFHKLDTILDVLTPMFDDCISQSNNVSENATNQAQELLHMNHLIKEINELARENVTSASTVSFSIEKAKLESKHGFQQLEELTVSMGQVQESSQSIQEVVSFIHHIANQTKLLSLNASIEAARAGNSGNGFSIVAKEIGNLANQSSEAVFKTTKFVEKMINNINHSESLTKEAAANFQNIVTSIEQATLLGEHIKSSTLKEIDAIKHIVDIVEHLSEMGDDNAALAEESSASLFLVQEQTEELKQILSSIVFKGQVNPHLIDSSITKQSALSIINEIRSSVFNLTSLPTLLSKVFLKEVCLECIYLIDSSGIQISDTFMNPSLTKSPDDSFTPCPLGFNHLNKLYFKGAINHSGTLYESHEYISSATGGLCKTYSIQITKENLTYVLCVDMSCIKS